MANNTAAQGAHPQMDYAEHEATYKLFTRLTKWGIIFNVALLVFMAVTLL